MSTPNPAKIKEVHSFKLKEKDYSFTITFSLENDSSLIIKVSEDDSVPLISYTGKYTLNELVKQNNYFKLFDNLEQLVPNIKNLCKENKISIQKDKMAVILTLLLSLTFIEDPHLTIPQDKTDPQLVIDGLCQSVNELKRQIKALSINKVSEEQLAKNLKSKDILLNEEEKNMVCNWILKQMKSEDKKIEMTLLYRLTTDGDSGNTFHNKCNNKGYTLSLIRNTKGFRCGGFTTKNWQSSGGYMEDKNAFLFSLEYKEQYFTYDGKNAIYDYYDNYGTIYGPSFGSGDIVISNNCSQNNSSSCNFPYSYGGSKPRSLSGGYYNFKVHEIEVYKINIV